MNEIRPNLYLGSRYNTRENQLREKGITNVLSVEWAKPALPSDVRNMFVYVHDYPDADLLSFMPECIRFIEESITSGSILVHCFRGMSRSATIIAAYLMKSENISFDEALITIRKARPMASPNVGFCQQLDLFQKMGFKLDKGDKRFKAHMLRELGPYVREYPVIVHDEIDCSDDQTLSDIDLAAICTYYEDIQERCEGTVKEKVESSILEWFACLKHFLKEHRKDIADLLPLDVQTRKSINPNLDHSANQLIEVKYHQSLESPLLPLLLTVKANNGLCLDVAVYQTAGYLCYLKNEFTYGIVTDSKVFVILEYKDDTTVIQRAEAQCIKTLMKYYVMLFLRTKGS